MGQQTQTNRREANQTLLTYVALPLLFLTVTLLGGLRVAQEGSLIFLPPQLITLILAVLLMLLFVRGGLFQVQGWLAIDNPPLTNAAHIWLLLIVFFASAQVFSSVLPERGFLHWLFAFCFLWTLWNNQFSSFDAKRLLRSLVVLFGTAFVLKHLLLASLFAPEGSWLKRLTAGLVQSASLGTLESQTFAPATGYISFFTIGLYIVGLILLSVSNPPSVSASTELAPVNDAVDQIQL